MSLQLVTSSFFLRRVSKNTVYVKSKEDLLNIDPLKHYLIDSAIDMGSQSIEIPAGGFSFGGNSTSVSKLYSTEDDYTLFVSADGGSGTIFGEGVTFDVSGLNSQVYDLTDATGFNAIELKSINYENCTSRGEINGYRQGTEFNVGLFGGSPTLTHSGGCSGWRTDISNSFNTTDGTVIHKAGDGLVFSGRFITEMNCNLSANGVFSDFSESNFSNDESFQINGARITRDNVINPADTTLIPNIASDSVKSKWSDNVGVKNTNKYIKANCTAEVETPIGSVDTYYALLGTFTVENSVHFDMPSNGELRLLTGSGAYSVQGDFIIAGSANDQIDIRVTKSIDGGSTFIEEVAHIRRQINNLSGSRDVAFFPLSFPVELNKNDRLRLEIENKSSSNNVTMELDSFFIIQEV